jgi:hypothetical protein
LVDIIERNLYLDTIGGPMKRSQILFSILTLTLLAGCQQPSDVEVATDAGGGDGVEIVPVVVPDTGLAGAWSDSSALLPLEQTTFGASFLLNRVTHDTGSGRVTIALSQVFFADSVVRLGGRQIGFSGRDFGGVVFNGALMLRYPHVIAARNAVGLDTALVRGVAYVANATVGYAPNRDFAWVVDPFIGRPVTVQVRTPDNLQVHAPLGGARVFRGRDLELRWTGAGGRMDIVISTYDPVRRKSRPILALNPPAGAGRAVIPARLMAGLPVSSRLYVFTFILSNRTESVSVPSYPARGYARAADVYNSYVEVR